MSYNTLTSSTIVPLLEAVKRNESRHLITLDMTVSLPTALQQCSFLYIKIVISFHSNGLLTRISKNNVKKLFLKNMLPLDNYAKTISNVPLPVDR